MSYILFQWVSRPPLLLTMEKTKRLREKYTEAYWARYIVHPLVRLRFVFGTCFTLSELGFFRTRFLTPFLFSCVVSLMRSSIELLRWFRSCCCFDFLRRDFLSWGEYTELKWMVDYNSPQFNYFGHWREYTELKWMVDYNSPVSWVTLIKVTWCNNQVKLAFLVMFKWVQSLVELHSRPNISTLQSIVFIWSDVARLPPYVYSRDDVLCKYFYPLCKRSHSLGINVATSDQMKTLHWRV